MFSRKQRSLHQLHAAAHAVGQDALSVFHAVADELERAADQHSTVADEANQQAKEMVVLRDSAADAAAKAAAQADAVRSLVS